MVHLVYCTDSFRRDQVKMLAKGENVIISHKGENTVARFVKMNGKTFTVNINGENKAKPFSCLAALPIKRNRKIAV